MRIIIIAMLVHTARAVSNDCPPLTAIDQTVIAAALRDGFSQDLGQPYAVAVLLDRTASWLPVTLGDDGDAGLTKADVDGLRSVTSQCAADLSTSTQPLPTYSMATFIRTDDSGTAPNCVADYFGAPTTTVEVSRPFVSRSGITAILTVSQRHSWNQCGLWWVVRLEHLSGGWLVTGTYHAILW